MLTLLSGLAPKLLGYLAAAAVAVGSLWVILRGARQEGIAKAQADQARADLEAKARGEQAASGAPDRTSDAVRRYREGGRL